jgi:hypothetical protein
MKRIAALMVALSIFLSGCGFFGDRIREPVTFHYLCSVYQKELCCVIVSEEREAAGHTADLSYLLALYQMEPANEEFRSPLPSGTKIVSNVQDGNIFLELSDTAATLSDLEYSIACACLTLTCLDITDAESVTVRCGSRSKTMTQSSLTLYDESQIIPPTEESQ